MTWLGGAVYVLVIVLLVVGLVRARHRPQEQPDQQPEEQEESSPSVVRRWLVGGGVVLPVMLVAVVFVLTVVAMRASSLEPDDDTLVIEVVGHQWWWEIAYPGTGIVTANEIHLPVGRPVELRLLSSDVIHSFWVPALGGKIDLLPDHVNTLVIRADMPGEYRGVCAEFCGLQHALMGMVAVAMPEEEFQSWLQGQAQPAVAPDTDLTRRGDEVFTAAGCGDCHTIRGTEAGGDTGPDLTHLAARSTLAAATMVNNPANLHDWVDDPALFKEGVEMPASQLTAADLEALVAYLESLQ
ncbi:MAG: cytochrome c oxidase subunit II [Actinomycetota bacterium]|nr:cytochrome c oxidase subunit II [Actinomycetota bacterium]